MVNGVTIPEYLPNGSNVSPLTDSNLGHCTTRRFTDLRISRHHRVSPVYLELTIIGSSPDLSIYASLPCISNATSWSFWELCISRSPALSRFFPDQHHAFWARTVSRLTAGRALPCLIRERQHWPGRVSGCHSGAHGLPGHLILL